MPETNKTWKPDLTGNTGFKFLGISDVVKPKPKVESQPKEEPERFKQPTEVQTSQPITQKSVYDKFPEQLDSIRNSNKESVPVTKPTSYPSGWGKDVMLYPEQTVTGNQNDARPMVDIPLNDTAQGMALGRNLIPMILNGKNTKIQHVGGLPQTSVQDERLNLGGNYSPIPVLQPMVQAIGAPFEEAKQAGRLIGENLPNDINEIPFNDTKQQNLISGGLGALGALLHGSMLPFTAPYAAITGAIKEPLKNVNYTDPMTGSQVNLGNELVSGADKAMNLPFDAVREAQKGTQKALETIGIDPAKIEKNMNASPELSQKISNLATELAGLYLMKKGHEGISELNGKQPPSTIINENQTQVPKLDNNVLAQGLNQFSETPQVFDINSLPKREVNKNIIPDAEKQTADLPGIEESTRPLTGAAKVFTEKKVKELGSIEAVNEYYKNKPDAVIARHAKQYAEKIFPKQEEIPTQENPVKQEIILTPEESAKQVLGEDGYNHVVNVLSKNPEVKTSDLQTDIGKRNQETENAIETIRKQQNTTMDSNVPSMENNIPEIAKTNENQTSPMDNTQKTSVLDNNTMAIQNLTERGKTPEEISKVLNVPVDEVLSKITQPIEQNVQSLPKQENIEQPVAKESSTSGGENKPIKVYRASTKGSFNQPGNLDGVYYAGDKSSASAYGDNIREATITPRKMFVGDPFDYVAKKYGVESPSFGAPDETFKRYNEVVNRDNVKKILLDEGYDSVKIPADSKYFNYDEYVVLDPSIIDDKSYKPKPDTKIQDISTQKPEENQGKALTDQPQGKKEESALEENQDITPSANSIPERTKGMDNTVPEVAKQLKGRVLFTPEELKRFDEREIDVSKVTPQYKEEALQQLNFKENGSKLDTFIHDLGFDFPSDEMQSNAVRDLLSKYNTPEKRKSFLEQSKENKISDIPDNMKQQLDRENKLDDILGENYIDVDGNYKHSEIIKNASDISEQAGVSKEDLFSHLENKEKQNVALDNFEFTDDLFADTKKLIDNGVADEPKAQGFIENTGRAEESEPVIENLESKAENPQSYTREELQSELNKPSFELTEPEVKPTKKKSTQESLFSGADNKPVFRTDEGMNKGKGIGEKDSPLFNQPKENKAQQNIFDQPKSNLSKILEARKGNKQEIPALPETPQNGVQKILEERKPINKNIVGDAPIIEEKLQTQKPYEIIQDFRKRLSKYDVTADEVKQMYQYLTKNKEAIIPSLKEFIKTIPEHSKRRDATITDMAEKHLRGTIDKLPYATQESYATPISDIKNYHQNVIDHIGKLVDDITDEQIQAHKESVFNKREKLIEQVKNPKNLKDLREAKYYRKLTPEETDRLEDLEAVDKRNRQKEQIQREVQKTDLGNLEITPDKDTRDNSDLWVVKMKSRVPAEEFNSISSNMKKAGGYWSRFKNGFIFKNDPTGILKGEAELPEKDLSNAVTKLRDVAQSQIEKADESLGQNRLANTARRANMAANAEANAEANKRIGKTMLNIADAIDGGDIALLKNLNSRTQIEELDKLLRQAKARTVQLTGESYDSYKNRSVTINDIRNAKMPDVYMDLGDAMRFTDAHPKTVRGSLKSRIAEAKKNGNHYIDINGIHEEIYNKLPDDSVSKSRMKDDIDSINRLKRLGIETDGDLRAALREYFNYRDNGNVDFKAKKIKELERNLIGTKIDGYFPTPKNVVEGMIDDANIKEGMSVLEPSAGKGNIADEIKNSGHTPDVIEYNNTLSNILKEKGHNQIASNFLDYNDKKYDRIIMNPPFENGLDIEHVKHAYGQLNPGGRIVALMGEGSFFRSDKKATDFRNWLEEVNGSEEKLPDGSFKTSERPTGVAVRKVIIDKPNADNRIISEDAYKEAKRNVVLKGLGQNSMGIDPTLIKDYAIIGGYHLENLVKKGIEKGEEFTKWSKEMISDFGDEIKEHLKTIWDNIENRDEILPKEVSAEKARTEISKEEIKSSDMFGVKKAKIETVQPNIEVTLKRDFPTVIEGGKKLYSAGKIDDSFIKKIIDNPRPLQAEETVALAYYEENLHNKIDEVAQTLNTAKQLGDQLKVSQAIEDLSALQSKVKSFNEAATVSNYEKGLGLATNKLLFQKRYSVQNAVNEIVGSLGGKELSESQLQDYQSKYGSIVADLKKSYEAYQNAEKTQSEKQALIDAQTTIDNLQKQLSKGTFTQRALNRKQNIADIQARRSELYKSLYKETSALNVNPFANVKATKILGEIAYEFVREGVTRAEDIVDRIYTDLKDKYEGLSKRDIMEAITNYGLQNTKTENELNKSFSDAKEAMKLMLKIEDAGNMKDVKLPTKGKAANESVEQLRKKLSGILKQDKLQEQDIAPYADNPDWLKDQNKLKTLRNLYEKKTQDLQTKINNKDFVETKQAPRVLDEVTKQKKADYEKKKLEYQREILKDKLANRTTYEKVLDGFTNWRRFDVLSSPKSILKILNALTLESFAAKPLTLAVAQGLVKLPKFRDVNEKAMLWRDPSLRDLTPFYNYEFSKEALNNFLKTTKGELTSKEIEMGKIDFQSEDFTGAQKVFSMPGRIHGAEKSLAKWGAYDMAKAKLEQSMLRQGKNPYSLENQALIQTQSHNFGNWSILMEDNALVKKVNNLLKEMKHSDSNTIKTLGTFFQSLVPVMKIPTNYVKRTATYSGGGVVNAISTLIRHGIEDLTPEQADKVIRNASLGTIGTMGLIIGYYSPDTFGGYYQPGEKRSSDDVGLSGIKGLGAFGKLLHHPLIEPFQIGATIRRVMDSAEKKGDGKLESVPKSLWTAGKGLVKQTPLSDNPLSSTLESFGGFKKFAGDYTKSVTEPLLLQNIATYLDTDDKGNPIKRRPEGELPEYLWQNLKTGIPLARKSVPLADPLYPIKIDIKNIQNEIAEKGETTERTNRLLKKIDELDKKAETPEYQKYLKEKEARDTEKYRRKNNLKEN